MGHADDFLKAIGYGSNMVGIKVQYSGGDRRWVDRSDALSCISEHHIDYPDPDEKPETSESGGFEEQADGEVE